MEILFPRMVLNSSLLNFDMSAPSNKICSDSIFAIFSGNNFNMDNAETDLPQPDSPTTARNSPLSTLKEIFAESDNHNKDASSFLKKLIDTIK